MVTRRKRKHHYHTGTWTGSKCDLPVEYRSGWELDVCRFLERDPAVVRFFYEMVVIPYISNTGTRKVRKYFPDFLVEYTSGKKVLVEVKRADKVNTLQVQKKILAGRAYAQKQGWEYEVWTEVEINKIRSILNPTKTLARTPRKKTLSG